MISYLLYKIGRYIALFLPLKLSYVIANFLSELNHLFNSTDKKSVTANLKAIFPDKSKHQIAVIRKSMFKNFAKYLVDFFRFSIIDQEYINKNVKLVNLHYFDQALDKGKGVIILTAHIGNWELGGVVIAQLGYPFWVVALPHKNKDVNKFFNSQRESKGIKVIQVGKAVRNCINLLKENKMVALVGDRDFSKDGGIMVDFMGKRALFPKGPAALAIKTGATIVPGFLTRNKDDSFTLTIEKPIEYKTSLINESGVHLNKIPESELINLTNQYKKLIESYIKKFPDQWYMFRKYWQQEDENLRSNSDL